jgi:hypothetical protein
VDLGDESDFRISLEAHISAKEDIPYALILMEGNVNDLKTVKKALEFGIPVVLVTVSAPFLAQVSVFASIRYYKENRGCG